MNKKLILLPLSLLLISGCSFRRDKKTVAPEASCQNSRDAIEERTSIFDEHEEGFVLDDSENPFAREGGDMELVDAPLWEQDEQGSELDIIYFDFDQYKIKPEQRPALERIATKVKPEFAREGTYLLVVEGHACKSAGTPRYNTMLSEQRAQEVKKALVKKGLPAEKIKTVGRGSEMCAVPDGTREQQAPNRRVKLYLVREVKS